MTITKDIKKGRIIIDGVTENNEKLPDGVILEKNLPENNTMLAINTDLKIIQKIKGTMFDYLNLIISKSYSGYGLYIIYKQTIKFSK